MIAQLNNVADIINYVREPGKITLRTQATIKELYGCV